MFLAPDPDREGEAIAWHLREVLKTVVPDKDAFSRVTYNEITPTAIKSVMARIALGLCSAGRSSRLRVLA